MALTPRHLKRYKDLLFLFLKLRKDALAEVEYFSQLQTLLLEMAEVQAEIEAEQAK